MNFGPVVGIDVSKRFSDMCILSPDNQIFAQTKIYHDSTSMKRAEALLKKATEAFGGRPAVVMEATSHYHLILFQFFSDCGYDVLVVNPLQSSSIELIVGILGSLIFIGLLFYRLKYGRKAIRLGSAGTGGCAAMPNLKGGTDQ